MAQGIRITRKMRTALCCALFYLMVVRGEDVNATEVVKESTGTESKSDDTATSFIETAVKTDGTGDQAEENKTQIESDSVAMDGTVDDDDDDDDDEKEKHEVEAPEIASESIVGLETDDEEEKEEEEELHDAVKRVVINYASMDAGAQVLETSPTSKGFHNLLVDDKDKYGITECAEKKMVVIRLTDEIQVTQVVLAQYEKYSSGVKEFKVLGSRTFPTKDWVPIGSFVASYGEGEQSFTLPTPTYVRYLKFRFLSHYGDEYMCTVSQIKVHGKTMMENFEQDLEQHDREVTQRLQAFDGESTGTNETETNETSFDEIRDEEVGAPVLDSSEEQDHSKDHQAPSTDSDLSDAAESTASIQANLDTAETTDQTHDTMTDTSDNTDESLKNSTVSPSSATDAIEQKEATSTSSDSTTIPATPESATTKNNSAVPLKKLATAVADKLLQVVTATAFQRGNDTNDSSAGDLTAQNSSISNASLTNATEEVPIHKEEISGVTNASSNASLKSNHTAPKESSEYPQKQQQQQQDKAPEVESTTASTSPASTMAAAAAAQTTVNQTETAEKDTDVRQSCLRNLDYRLFKERMLLKSTQQAVQREVTAPPVPGYDSIFKTLMDKIKAFEINHSIAERYLVQLHACFASSLEQIESNVDSKLEAIRAEVRHLASQQDVVDGGNASTGQYEYRGPRLRHWTTSTQLREDGSNSGFGDDTEVSEEQKMRKGILPLSAGATSHQVSLTAVASRALQWTFAKLRELDDADKKPSASPDTERERDTQAPLELPQFNDVFLLCVLLALIACLATLITCTCFVFFRLETLRAMLLAQPKAHHHYYPAVIETPANDGSLSQNPSAGMQPFCWEAQPSSLRFRKRGAPQLVPQDDLPDESSSGKAAATTTGVRIPVI